jgi:dUTP pyrophosphatase
VSDATDRLPVLLTRLDPDLPIPSYAHPGDAGADLASKHGISLVNAPGTIDAGYRGEISVIVINHDPVSTFTLRRGDRVAQLVIQPVVTAHFVEVSELPGSHRGEGGFGSTGLATEATTL